MKKILSLLLFTTLLLSASTRAQEVQLNPTSTESVSNKNSAVTARLIANTKTIIPGKSFKLGVELIMKPGWHTYYKEPGDAGMPTKIIWQLPTGFSNSELHWQKPSKFVEGGITTYGYINNTILVSEITAPSNLHTGESLGFSASVKWLSCKDICVPGQAEVSLTLPVSQPTSQNNSDNTTLFADKNFETNASTNTQSVETLKPASRSKLFTYFVFAIIGGFLLNFMPCVLPVVAIKILSLLEQPDKDSIKKTVIAFSSGVLFSFLLLGLIVVALQAAGQNIGWGFQFQQPLFLMAMSALVLLFALSLLGLFDFSVHFGQKTVDNLAEREGFVGDFFKGVLATILSTPCTAPFLGTALGFAFVEPWSITLSIFAAIGTGMCSPYLVLLIAPQYLKFLPKPGDWMTKLKEAFGFVLLATVLWLLSILYYQIPAAAVINFTYFLLSIAFAIWLLNRFTNLASSGKRLLIVRSIAAVLLAISAYLFIFKNSSSFLGAPKRSTNDNTSSISNKNESFDLATLSDALRNRKTVFLDFGAQWCLTCQLNENAVINTKAIQDKFRSLNVLFLKADWTRQDPVVTQLLKKYERSGVPFYIIFPGRSPDKPIILPELLTQDIVLQKLDEAGPSLDKK